MSLQRCKREHTWQEFMAWQVYLDEQEEHPSRTDHYLMQIACTISNVFSGKKSKRWTIKDFVLKFKRRKRAKPNRADRTAMSKAVWFGITGYKPDKDQD